MSFPVSNHRTLSVGNQTATHEHTLLSNLTALLTACSRLVDVIFTDNKRSTKRSQQKFSPSWKRLLRWKAIFDLRPSVRMKLQSYWLIDWMPLPTTS
jgi:hypothetical protein